MDFSCVCLGCCGDNRKPEDQTKKQEGDKQEDAEMAAKAEAEEKERWRTWTNVTGEFTIYARFESRSGGKVRLRKEDGERFEVEIVDLSDADKTFINEFIKKRR